MYMCMYAQNVYINAYIHIYTHKKKYKIKFHPSVRDNSVFVCVTFSVHGADLLNFKLALRPN